MANQDTIKSAAQNIFNRISHDGTHIDTEIFEEEIKIQFGNSPSNEIRTEVMIEVNRLIADIMTKKEEQADN